MAELSTADVLHELRQDPGWLAQACGLPAETLLALLPFYLPLGEDIARRQASKGAPLIVGIQAPQGAGKSTLVQILKAVLQRHAALRVACLSIDDLYLTRAQRGGLATRVHPLFITRGVPGTHDPQLGMRTLDALVSPGETAIPRFDKGRDDRAPQSEWPVANGPCDLVLFEGLWIGLPPIPEADLAGPRNALEADEDPQGQWRRHANRCLANEYLPLFGRCEHLVHLRVPDFACVRRWRAGAEHALRARLEAEGADTSRVMDGASLERFFDHYERFTAHAMAAMPARADVVLTLDHDHRVIASTLR